MHAFKMARNDGVCVCAKVAKFCQIWSHWSERPLWVGKSATRVHFLLLSFSLRGEKKKIGNLPGTGAHGSTRTRDLSAIGQACQRVQRWRRRRWRRRRLSGGQRRSIKYRSRIRTRDNYNDDDNVVTNMQQHFNTNYLNNTLSTV